MAQAAESEQRIKDLEGEVRVLTEEKDGGTMELERQVSDTSTGSNMSVFGFNLILICCSHGSQTEGQIEENVNSDETQ